MVKNRDKELAELLRWSIRWKIIGLVSLSIPIALLLLVIGKYIVESCPTWSNILEYAAKILLTAGTIGIVYEFLMKRLFNKELSGLIMQTIHLNVDTLKKIFKTQAIGNFIEKGIIARIGEITGRDLYKNLVEPYINVGQEKFRDSLQYEIHILPLDQDVNSQGMCFKKSDYFRIEEKLFFTKRLNSLVKEREFLVGCAFNDLQLEPYLRGDIADRCLYREILRIREEHEEKLQKLNEIPQEILNIEIKINEYDLGPPKCEKYSEDQGFKMVYMYNKDMARNKKNYDKFEIKVVALRDKTKNFYTAYLVEPSFNPSIRLNYNDEIINLVPAVYFTCKSGHRTEYGTEAKYVIVRTKGKEWVFPLSGATFLWEKAQFNIT